MQTVSRHQKQSSAAAGMVLLLLLLLSPLPTSATDTAVAAIVSRQCSARWTVLSSQHNRGGGPHFQVRLDFIRGPKDSSPGQGDRAPDDSLDHMTLVGLEVRISAAGGYAHPAESPTVHLTGSELTRPIERSLTVTVPDGASVTIWQLVAVVGQRQFGLEHTGVTTSGLGPPGDIVACTASYATRPLIREDSPVRLRHAPTGLYLVMTHKRGWEAATLGHSREFRYRLRGVGTGMGVRIDAETHTYGGYRYAYSSLRGTVYFNVWQLGSESQQWTLSNPYPRDGDSVTIRNVRWPAAALTYYRGSTTNVYCLNTHTPDLWILEMA